MRRDKELDPRVYDADHINDVLNEIQATFPKYFTEFCDSSPELRFMSAISDHESEHPKYQVYMDLRGLDEFEENPSPFKGYTKSKCPIIRKCLMSNDEVMKQYKISFNQSTGKQILSSVRKIAEFGIRYVAAFEEHKHEQSTSYEDLNLSELTIEDYGCPGVIGFGIQSGLLFGLYPHAFAHRSQNAVWSLYFITNRKDFGIEDDSEFLMVRPEYSSCEQNYYYPADLFGFYALKLYLMLKQACLKKKITFENKNRYIYLSAFTDFISELHHNDIMTLKWSSEHVENHWF